jgi:hypothetical protein
LADALPAVLAGLATGTTLPRLRGDDLTANTKRRGDASLEAFSD